MLKALIDVLKGKSPRGLVRAAKAGDVARLEELLDAGVPVDCMAQGVFPLFGAAFYHHLEAVEVLRARGASLELQVDADGTTALHALAQIEAPTQVCDAILKGAKNVDLKSDIGLTPLMVACQFNRAAMVKSLLAHGADVNATVTGSMAIEPLPGDVLGFTPLVLAIQNGHDALVATLLTAGARLGAQLQHQPTELILAANSAGPDCIRALIAAGADPNAAAGRGELAGITALVTACVLPASNLKGSSAIETAAFLSNRLNVIRALIEFGADPEAKGPGGKSAVDVAEENGLLQLSPDLFGSHGEGA